MDQDNCTDSDGEAQLSSSENLLCIPEHITSMSHSATTDTLESVTLDPAPSTEQEDGVELGNAEHTSPTGGITFEAESAVEEDIRLSSPSDQSSDRMLSPGSTSDPGHKDDANSKPDLADVFQSVKMDESISLETDKPNLSSYFGASDAGAGDFFDSISEVAQTEGGDQTATSQQEDQIETRTEPDNIQQLLDTEHTVTEAKVEHQETVTSKQPEIPHDMSSNLEVYHAEDMVASSEPETVSFEGEVSLATNNDRGETQTQELLDQSDEEFESFTAQGEEVESAPADQAHSYEPDSPLRSADETKTQDSLYPGYHQSLHQTPSVGTTPTQLSPLSTPVHHPQTPLQTGQASPEVSGFTYPNYDRQSSVPSSPFHQAVPSVFTNLEGENTSDDPFTASIGASDADRRFDAWIPSDATRHILFTMTTSPPGSYLPTQEQLTTPVVLHNKPMVRLFFVVFTVFSFTLARHLLVVILKSDLL